VPREPRDKIARQVRCRLQWPLRYLEGVIEVPTIRTDGSILDRPGWDEPTRLLYEALPVFQEQWHGIPEHPTREAAQHAVSTLLRPVVDFPWVAPTDQSTYVAAVLTLVGRHLIDGPTPMFAIRAPTPGTGKSLLADVIALVGTGRVFPSMAATDEAEEMRKRIHALAIDGTPAILLDNVSGSIGSDALAAALTRVDWEDRILGLSQIVRVPLRVVWFCTGNNVTFRRTMQRRVLLVDLDAKMEVPEDRKDFVIPDLVAYITARRVEFATAALTMLRAFILAGRPRHPKPRMGSFEAWDDLIRSAVLWCGLEDPASTREGEGRGRLRAQVDDEVEQARQLLDVLAELYPSPARFTTQDVFDQVAAEGGLTERRRGATWRRVLDTNAASKSGHATAASLGYKLREIRDRPFGGYRICCHGKGKWSIEPAAGDGKRGAR
jgi:putative DNA primase/helicase